MVTITTRPLSPIKTEPLIASPKEKRWFRIFIMNSTENWTWSNNTLLTSPIDASNVILWTDFKNQVSWENDPNRYEVGNPEAVKLNASFRFRIEDGSMIFF